MPFAVSHRPTNTLVIPRAFVCWLKINKSSCNSKVDSAFGWRQKVFFTYRASLWISDHRPRRVWVHLFPLLRHFSFPRFPVFFLPRLLEWLCNKTTTSLHLRFRWMTIVAMRLWLCRKVTIRLLRVLKNDVFSYAFCMMTRFQCDNVCPQKLPWCLHLCVIQL